MTKKHSSLIALAALVAASSASAQIVSDFTTDLNTPSTGWNAGWLLRRPVGTVTVNTAVVNTNPVAGGGNYLSVSGTPSTAGVFGVARQYAPSLTTVYNGVERDVAHTISFSFRMDDLTGWSSGEDVTVGDLNSTAENNGVGSASGWWIRAHFSNNGTAVAGNWALFNGTQNGVFTNTRYVDSGIPLVAGTTYSFTLSLTPETRVWTASINDGVNTFTSGTLGFRTANFQPNGVLGFFRTTNSTADVTAFSVDSINIIPEPSTYAAIAGAGALGLVLLRRRSRR